MKRRLNKSHLFFFYLLVVFFSCNKETEPTCICTAIPQPIDKYSYPIKPGDKAWSELSDTYQRIAVCQVPDSVLKVISTHGLMETCLDNPLIIELIFSDLQGGGLQLAMDKLTSILNCLTELTHRSDAGKELLQRYLLMEVCCVQSSSNPGRFACSYSEFETLFAQPCFLGSLNSADLKKLITKALYTYNRKIEFSEFFSWVYGMNTTGLIMARSMNMLNYQPFISDKKKYLFVDNFIERNALPANEDDFKMLFNIICKNAQNLLNNSL